MQKIENQYTFTRLEQITHVLLINSSAIRDISLGNGKCGLALYFFCLAHQTGNPMYKHYANQLLDEMSDALDKSIPTGFEDGFTGIGCTIEYLSRRKWIEDDTDEILEAFDTRIRQMLQYDHCGLNTLYHLLCYLTLRLSNPAPNRKPEQLTHLTEQLAFISRQIGRTLAGEPRPDTPDAPFDLLWNLPLALLCLNQLPPHIRQIEPIDTLCRQLHHKAEATLQSE